MTVAILGAGRMGAGLARRLAAAGETVALSSRDPAKAAETAKALGGRVKLASSADAVAEADIVILAVGYPDVAKALKSAGDLTGKILIDMTNAVGPNLSMALPNTTSAAEEIQKLAPGATVVKAFNTVFAALLDGERPQTFVAADDEEARKRVAALAARMGFEPIDVGPLQNARQLEALGSLIIRLAYGLGRGTRFAPALVNY